MRKIETVSRVGAPGCVELGEAGLVDTSRCCDVCHSAERYAPDFVLGPCRVVLSDGEEAFVCCSSRTQLSRDRRGPGDAKEMVGR